MDKAARLFIEKYSSIAGLHAFGVYFTMRFYAGTKDHCFPSIETMASQIGIGEKQVKQGVKVLEKYSIIRVVRHKGSHSNYYFNPPDRWIDTRNIELAPRGNNGDLFWPKDIPCDFPDKALTCGRLDHRFIGETCIGCGLVQSEDFFKTAGEFSLRGRYSGMDDGGRVDS